MPDAARPRPDLEADLIGQLAAVANSRPSPPLGIGDDAALLESGWLWSTDMLVQDVHFDDRLAPADVGYKAVAVSVSDIAAMGARARAALLAIAVHADGDQAFVQGLASGVAAALDAFEVQLVGGDTCRSSGPRVITSTVGGPRSAHLLRRDAAVVGDDLWVTGALGAAGAGWSRLRPTAEQLVALQRPAPPVRFAAALGERGLGHAAMDLSDGLAVDLPRLCAAARVGADVRADALPIADGCTLLEAVHGGEDYQLLLTAPPAQRGPLERLATTLGVRLTRIGAVQAPLGCTLDGGPWPRPLFAHFGSTQS